MNALHICATHGASRTLMDLLLHDGAELDARMEGGETALLLAAKNWNLEVVELLLEKGASITALDEDQNTLLHKAARGGSAEVMERVLAALGQEPNASKDLTARWVNRPN